MSTCGGGKIPGAPPRWGVYIYNYLNIIYINIFVFVYVYILSTLWKQEKQIYLVVFKIFFYSCSGKCFNLTILLFKGVEHHQQTDRADVRFLADR